MAILIAKKRTPQELLSCFEDRGKGRGRLSGGYIDDLAQLGKSIWLCTSCTKRFNSKVYNYVVKKDLPKVRGNCDGCRVFGVNIMFVPSQHCDGYRGLSK